MSDLSSTLSSAAAPDEASFRALARSSPWLWSTLRFDLERRKEGRLAPWSASAQVKRPTSVRVEVDGQGRYAASPPLRGRDPATLDVPRRADGLVAERVYSSVDMDDNGTYFQDYHWVAMLDPWEIADPWAWYGDPPSLGRGPATALSGLARSERFGRETWWAEVSALPDYAPRCSCCPLLYSEASEAQEVAAGAPARQGREPHFVYSTSWLVGLDRQTGVCVSIDVLDGTLVGTGHRMVIHAVDEPMDDGLFAPQHP